MICGFDANNQKAIVESVSLLVEKYGTDKNSLIPILQSIQSKYNYLPEKCLEEVSMQTNIPLSDIYGVATFYAFFSLEPKGKNIIKVCNGTACHVRNNKPIVEAARKVCNIADGSITSSDMMFTVELVNCLGACGLAPAIVVNDKVYGRVTPDKVAALVNEINKSEEGA